MSKVFVALAVSVDGYVTGRDPGAGRGLGDGTMLFDWYSDGDTPSQVFDGFRLSEPSARVFDDIAGRVGASLAGRNTYDDSGWEHGGTPHPTAPLVVLSHRPMPANDRQTLVTTGIEDAVAVARDAANRQSPAAARARLCRRRSQRQIHAGRDAGRAGTGRDRPAGIG